MSFFADDMRGGLGNSESHFDTCSIAIVCRSLHYATCVIGVLSIGQTSALITSAMWCYC